MSDGAPGGQVSDVSAARALGTAGVMIYERLLPAVPRSIPRIRNELGVVLAFCALDAQRRSDIALFVTEAVANTVQHAYAEEPGLLYAAAEVDGDWLSVATSDWGHGLSAGANGEAAPALPAREHRGPGLGLGLITRLADALSIDSDRTGTHVEGWFELAGAASRSGPSADVRGTRAQMVQEYLRVLRDTKDTLQQDTAAVIAEAQQAVSHSRARRRARTGRAD